MTADVRVGVVDVYVVRPYRDEWLVLVLRRAAGVRCPGAWEAVHGSVEPGERAEQAAVRELREETGLAAERLYSITAHSFYVAKRGTVETAVVFAAFVAEPGNVVLADEHDAHAWLPLDEAAPRFQWPRAREALSHIVQLLGRGDAGPAEDVLRVV